MHVYGSYKYSLGIGAGTLPTLSFLRQCFSLAWNSPGQAAWTASPGLCCCSMNAGIASTYHSVPPQPAFSVSYWDQRQVLMLAQWTSHWWDSLPGLHYGFLFKLWFHLNINGLGLFGPVCTSCWLILTGSEQWRWSHSFDWLTENLSGSHVSTQPTQTGGWRGMWLFTLWCQCQEVWLWVVFLSITEKPPALKSRLCLLQT